jgi:heat shock protein HslJ
MVLLSGCITDRTPDQPRDARPPAIPTTIPNNDPQLTNIRWKLIEINGRAVSEFGELNHDPYLMLDANTGRLGANAGCNSLMGSFELMPGGRIVFSPIASTMMACPQMELEHLFAQVLPKVERYSIAGGILSMGLARKTPMLRFSRNE